MTNVSLLHYWKDAALREKLSTASFSLEYAVSLSSIDLKNGMIQDYVVQNKSISKTVWIAPFKIIKKSSADTWIPLWIPANLIEGQLKPSTVCALPWIPTQFFDLQSDRGTLFENIEQYDKLLLDYFFDAQANLVVYSNWETYFSRCVALFQTLLRPYVRDILQSDYTMLDDGWMIEVLDDSPVISTALAKQYVAIEPCDVQEYKIDESLIKGYYPNNTRLLDSQKIALMQLLSLKEGDIQALTIPPGTDKQGFFKGFIASVWSQAAFEKTSVVPAILLIDSQKPVLDLSVPDFSEVLEYDNLREGMQILIDYIALNNTLKQKFESVQRVDNILLESQLEDQKLEIEFERCTQRYAQWQKQHNVGVWAKLATWLPNARKRREKLAKQFFDDLFMDAEGIDQTINIEQLVIEKIRKIKVTRTKIHNELVDICQWIASKNGLQNRWSSWAQKNIPHRAVMDLEENLLWIQQQCGESLFKLACDSFNTSFLNKMSVDEALEHSFEGLIDYLIIDNAHRITPSKILPLLNKAKIAIFLGDDKGFLMRALVSPLYDNCLLKSYYLNIAEEDLEDLAYKGIQANGSAFCIAKTMSRFKKMQPDGYEAYCELSLQEQTQIHPAIFEYSRSIYLRRVQVLAKTDIQNSLPPLCYVHIKGVKQAFELSFRNTIEADILVDWLVKNRTLCTSKSIAIITLFLAQKQYITQRLAQLKLTTPIYLLSEVDNVSEDIILFSPVYTSLDTKPYLLDQGDAYLNVALTRARESFMIFADMDIFNPHTHSPCGQMAKLLFQKEGSYV